MRWSAKFCADLTSVALTEASVSDMGRDLDVRVNDKACGRISLLRSYGPGVAIGATGVLIWGGVRLYWIERDATDVARFDMTEEVFAAFEISARQWLLVFELSVGLWQPDLGVRSRVDIDDVIVSIAQDDAGLFLRDFAGRGYRVVLAGDVLQLQRV